MASDSSYTEKALLEKTAQGDEAAFAELFRRFYPKVYQVGILISRSREQAEELVQDVFLKIWLKKEQLAGVRDVASYIFIIARNQAYQYLRREAKQRLVMAGIGEGSGEGHTNETEETVLTNNYRRILEEAVNRLPQQQQAVYRLSKIEGWKREEIAEQLQIQPNTVKEYLSLATKNIRAYFVAHSDLLPSGAVLVLSLWLQAGIHS